MADLADEVRANFASCAVFFRDTTLPEAVLARYRPGLLLREPTFCDVSHRAGGFVAPHRYLVFSASARVLPDAEGWGLCLWPRGRIFKILDQVSDGRYAQVTLLEIPEHLVEVFLTAEPNTVERAYIGHGRDLFEELRNAPPVPELDTDRWRDRLTYPVGVDDEGRYFPLYRPGGYRSDGNGPPLVHAVRHLTHTLLDAGAYADAEAQVRAAIEAARPFADRSPETLAALLVTQSDLHLRMADHRAAENDLHEAFHLYRRLDEDRLPVAEVLSSLGHLYQSTGDDAAAERHHLHSLGIRRRVAGERDVTVIPTLVSLGALCEGQNRFPEARRWLAEARDIARAAGQPESPVLLNNLARLHQATGQFEAAERDLGSALARLAPESRGTQQLTLLANLAEVRAARGQTADALRLLTEVIARHRETVDQFGSFASEEQRLALLRVSRSRLAQYVSLVLTSLSDQPEHVRQLADLILDWKGLGIDALARDRDALVSGRHPQLRPMLDELGRLRAWIAQRRLDGPDARDPHGSAEELRRATWQLRELEKALARALSVARTDRPSTVDAMAVARATPSGAATVEFLRYAPFDFHAVRSRGDRPWQPHRYLAVVLTPARPDQPVLVDLGAARTIDELVAGVRTQLTGYRGHAADERADAAEQLHDAVFEPLRAAIGDSRRLLLAPDGELLRLPFEVLPDRNGGRLIDGYTISYLTAARDLLRLRATARPTTGPPLVVAAPDFDLGGVPSVRRPLLPLEGARLEGEVVGRLLGVPPSLAGEATKTLVERASSPLVLHFATHGFVLPQQPPLSPEKFAPGMTIRPADPDREMLVLNGTLATPTAFVPAEDSFARLTGRGPANPLLRAGLALAGANTWLEGDEAPPVAGNGILTALEVTDLALAGTELVVLSACDTGLGDVEPGEGVLGLRRSFLIAGARTLVLSLWKVPDEQTRYLMEHFYRLLRDGRSRVEALREAQLLTRESWPAPRHWGAFVCQGDDGPLPGLPPTVVDPEG
ncbi:CHAT domain-containing protein [Micromonospora sp. NBRC 101691]|uniref:CHAT domain-containing protein n=1 Tax=Micromonospora sp. NBRC 101691 TaxID=3032198 RepID=UPI00249FCF2C|nr:CHAT domain-containing protein [Micromonospora sp. NBRC 101691]GLY20959.1 hypothetical protein Misp04_06910 [Micromonospora sp. NBRC 101691]